MHTKLVGVTVTWFACYTFAHRQAEDVKKLLVEVVEERTFETLAATYDDNAYIFRLLLTEDTSL